MDGLTCQLHNHIIGLHTSGSRRAASSDTLDKHTRVHTQVTARHDALTHRDHAYAQDRAPGVAHMPIGNQLLRDKLDAVRWNSKAQAVRWRVKFRVDSVQRGNAH